jgi:ABC-2 type transport system permease protein
MKGLMPLLKKEIKEQFKTYRFLVVMSVFLLFGLTTPLTLKYLPEIIKMAGEGMEINFPPPTAIEALLSYSGDISQIGIFVIVLVAMGSIANEMQRGTALMVLSKPVSRTAFVTAKLLALSMTSLVSLAASSLVCFGYTVWLIGGADVSNFIGLNIMVGLFMVFSIAITLLFSSIFRSSLAAGGTALAVIIGQAILTAVPKAGDFMPGQLLGWGNNILTGGDTYWWALGVTVVLIVLFVYLSHRALSNKDM